MKVIIEKNIKIIFFAVLFTNLFVLMIDLVSWLFSLGAKILLMIY